MRLALIATLSLGFLTACGDSPESLASDSASVMEQIATKIEGAEGADALAAIKPEIEKLGKELEALGEKVKALSEEEQKAFAKAMSEKGAELQSRMMQAMMKLQGIAMPSLNGVDFNKMMKDALPK